MWKKSGASWKTKTAAAETSESAIKVDIFSLKNTAVISPEGT
jgi:hypothetical protein